MRHPGAAAIVIVSLTLAGAASSGRADSAQKGPPPPQKMTTYQLVMLKQGPNVGRVNTPDGQKAVSEHMAFLYKQAAAGVYLAAGPFTDGGEIEGIIVVAAQTPERAVEIESKDPAVAAGIFAADVLPFLSPEGRFSSKWSEAGKFERVFFGFLNNGPDRTQDEATAQLLQARHLGYMEMQSRAGKLIVAGPFLTEDGTRRGLVVYRVATPDEARELANADPMVKAGRLAVELHEWQVPVGALPPSK